MVKLAFITSITNSIAMLISLKVLHLFHFVQWKPIAFLNSIYYIRLFGVYEKWLVLGVIIFLVSFGIFMMNTLIPYVPTLFISFLWSAIIVFVVHSFIIDFQYEWKEIKKVSIPFIAVVLISIRFIIDTSSFHIKEKLLRHAK